MEHRVEPLNKKGGDDEFARRATITITTHTEWSEEDFQGDLEKLRSHVMTDADFIEDFYSQTSFSDLIEGADIKVTWENIRYTDRCWRS